MLSPVVRRGRARPVVAALVGLLALFAVGGCGGSDDPTMGASGEESCVLSGDRLAISADDMRFDKDCMAAPANRPFSIVLSNEENLPHDVDILEGDDSSDRVFDGEIFSGKRAVAYQVPPLSPGTYSFRCSVHPAQMRGTLRVR